MKQLRHFIVFILLFTNLYVSAGDIKDFGVHFKLSQHKVVGEDTNHGPASVGVPTDRKRERQFEMHPDFEKHFKLMPLPQKIELLNGHGLTASSLRSIFLQGISTRPVLNGVLANLPLSQKTGAG
ncbi:MAG: hypothetical protein ABIN67_21450, partial [Ferruginibacter sp.]